MKITRPKDRGSADHRPDPGSGAYYQGRFIDYPSPYLELECGHWTTAEEQETCRLWRPKKKDYYCNKCNRWLNQKPKPKPKPLPDEPMF